MKPATLRPRGRAAWTLPGEPASVRVFRGLARATAAGDEDQAEAAALCVSELVTNALVHTRSGLPGGNVTVRFEASPGKGGMRVSVHDDGARPAGTTTARGGSCRELPRAATGWVSSRPSLPTGALSALAAARSRGASSRRRCGMAADKGVRRWPLVLIAAPAAVAVWSGWVGLGTLCGFGIVHPLPGIAPGFELNTAITLPVGVEAYGAYALGAWLTPGAGTAARRSPAGRRWARWGWVWPGRSSITCWPPLTRPVRRGRW